tara:strand:- start:3117 stop:3305 length:189 start_codon:yes stop_codon:yes gene_type:complete
MLKRINPIARAMLRLRKPKQVIPNKKKNLPPEYDDEDIELIGDVYIDMDTGKVMSGQKEEND